ncbi:MAG: hypothetical protein V7785_21850 [Bermanella sp.]
MIEESPDNLKEERGFSNDEESTSQPLKNSQNCVHKKEMDIYEIRHQNFMGMLEEYCGGKVILFSEKSGINRSKLSQYKQGPIRTDRRIGSNIARRMEIPFGKAKGWMDHDHNLSDPVKRKKELSTPVVPVLDVDQAFKYLDTKELPDEFKTIPEMMPGSAGVSFALKEVSTQFEPAISQGATYYIFPMLAFRPEMIKNKLIACSVEGHILVGRLQILALGKSTLILPDKTVIELTDQKKQVIGLVPFIRNP